MVDQKKIIMMSKLAIYEKRHMRIDRYKLNYYIEDYIYIKNFLARLGITIIIAINICTGAFRTVHRGIIFPTSLGSFIEEYIAPYILPWIIGMIIYTIISTYQSGRAYRAASKRFGEYDKLLKKLDEYDSHQTNNEGAADEIK